MAQINKSKKIGHWRSMNEDLTIRLATTDDLDEVMRLAVTACEENGFLNASVAALAKEIYPALLQDHGLCPVIGPTNGEIQGLALLQNRGDVVRARYYGA